MSKKLKGFFVRNIGTGQLVSMDDNGLGDYTLKFSVAASFILNEINQNTYITVTPEGILHVKALADGQPNTGAINKTPYVKVDLVANSDPSKVLATRYVKVGVSQFGDVVTQGLTGTSTVEVESGSTNTIATLATGKTFDQVYSDLGISGAQFNSTYMLSTSSIVVKNSAGDNVPTGISIYNSTQGGSTNQIYTTVSSNVMPGVYTITAKYVSNISSDPSIDVKITLTVNGNKVRTLSKQAAMWTTDGKAIIRGVREGSAWIMKGNIFDLYTPKALTTAQQVNAPNTTYEFSLVPQANNANYYNGITISPATGATSTINLDPTVPNARTFIGTGKAVNVRLTTKVNGNVYTVEQFVVNFVNPVLALETKELYKEFTDQEVSSSNTSSVDLRRTVTLKDFAGEVIYNWNGSNNNSTFNTGLVAQYGINNIAQPSMNANNTYALSTKTFVKAENADGSTYTLGSGQSATVSGHNAVWTNTGALLQQPIYLVYRVTVTNKFNLGLTGEPAAQVQKEVRIKVNPRN